MKSTKFEEVSRDDFSDETPPALLATVFEMNEDEYKIEEIGDNVTILRLINIQDCVSDKPEEVEVSEAEETVEEG